MFPVLFLVIRSYTTGLLEGKNDIRAQARIQALPLFRPPDEASDLIWGTSQYMHHIAPDALHAQPVCFIRMR